MSKRSRSKANIPAHRASLFWILSPVFCFLPKTPIPAHRASLFWILSPVSCLLLYPPILPSLPRIHGSIMQNKPNFLKTKTNATFFAAKVYEEKPPLGDSKKQTQSNPISLPHPPGCSGGCLCPCILP